MASAARFVPKLGCWKPFASHDHPADENGRVNDAVTLFTRQSGCGVGEDVGADVGDVVGSSVSMVGDALGVAVGVAVGCGVVGEDVGADVGCPVVGFNVGEDVGLSVASCVQDVAAVAAVAQAYGHSVH